MARKRVTPTPGPASPVQGKSFWLDHKMGRYTRRESLPRWIEALGGRVQDTIDATLDYLVLHEDRRKADKECPAQKQASRAGGSITTIYRDDLQALLLPSRELALAILRGGPNNRQRWEAIQRQYLPEIDLSRADLRGLDLTGFSLRGCDLDGVLLDGAQVNEENFFFEPRNIDFR